MCSWQFEGQCWSASFQLRALGGRVAVLRVGGRALKVIGSPTFQVSPGAGEVIVAVGGVLPAEIATASVADASWSSVTLTPAR